jgi:hypothetical protein
MRSAGKRFRTHMPQFLGVTNVAEQICVFQSQPLLATCLLLGSLLIFK